MIKIISIMADYYGRKLIVVWFLSNYEVKDVMNLKVAIA